MKRFTILKRIALTSLLLICIFAKPNEVYAADSATVTISSASAEVGDEVSVTVKVSSEATILQCDLMINYDSSVVQYVSGGATGGAGVVRILDNSKTTFELRFKVLKAGEASIYISQDSINNHSSYVSSEAEDYVNLTVSSGKITGTAPVNYSTNNNLASLQISPGVLSPAFSSSTTTYTTSVGSDVERLTVSAVAEDSKASIDVSGTYLDPGSNTTTITVTAENGSKKVYTIYTTRAAKEEPTTEPSKDFTDVDVTVNKQEYFLKSDFSEHPLPLGYTESEYDYNGNKIKVGIGTNTKLTLCYLDAKDKKNGESGFYVYDSVAKTFTLYVEISEPEITYCILGITDSMEKPEGYKLMDYNMSGKTISVMMNEDRTYLLFYGISSQGVTGWFRYCIADSTIQSFDGSQDGVSFTPIQKEEEEVTDKKEINYKRLFYIAAIASVIILILTIPVIISLAVRLKKAGGDRDEEKLYDDYVDKDDEDFKLEETEFEELTLMDIDEDEEEK